MRRGSMTECEKQKAKLAEYTSLAFLNSHAFRCTTINESREFSRCTQSA